ncbi:MAG: 3-oxoacyl-ACP reductase FabG [Sulfolobales archaeon]|nr:3-oxoacyl-ACP reductase FabG [Sulfolobales archaeon]MCX8208167.1 3-oxoacyl-ACP reductase FabG [Sulfolobales archaeon]MDW8010983.1 3-oxoacyl-ACP reductase FabG [Sulfolobales archaeon]
MVWKLVTYTELYTPVPPYKTMFAIGVVEDEKGSRAIVRIDRKYFGRLRTGMVGDVVDEWTVFGTVKKFIPKEEVKIPRVAIITGGSGGIGSAIAIELARAGYSIALSDVVYSKDTERTLEAVRALGVDSAFVTIDVSSRESVEKGIGEVIGKFGRVDVLVNNAGITRDAYIQRMTPEDWDAVIKVNLAGAFYCSRAVVPHMIRSGGGVIVNISSIVGLVGNVGQTNYAASKSGLVGITYTLAKELAPYGIRVVAIAPGFVKTRMALAVPKSILRDYLKRSPIPRLIEPEEVAKLVRHVVENEALNGVVIPIDLGLAISSPKA